MIPEFRKTFNASFNETDYGNICEELNHIAGKKLDFRVAETPVFVPKKLQEEMIRTCEYVIDFIESDDFLKKTDTAIPHQFLMNGTENKAQFMVFDFAVTTNEKQELKPALIELQGFPSLFAFQYQLDQIYRKTFRISERVTSYLSNKTSSSYIDLLKHILVGTEDPKEVVLLDLHPEKQKTEIDFILTEKLTGVKAVCIKDIIEEDTHLYYLRDGKKTRIKRIFNRFVPDEWTPSIAFDFNKERDVEWINHPHSYFRISKFLLPFLRHECIPETYFLSDFKAQFSLRDSVVKPLFSFAGNGVIMDVNEENLREIQNTKDWIIQKKINYAPVIETPNDPAKTEVRIFYFRETPTSRPIPVHNLARISKGTMIGTQFNKNKDWVGGSIAYFDQA
jgi:hypothetical protein